MAVFEEGTFYAIRGDRRAGVYRRHDGSFELATADGWRHVVPSEQDYMSFYPITADEAEARRRELAAT
jgi:hypothetical protein